jgi:hypothetical protein
MPTFTKHLAVAIFALLLLPSSVFATTLDLQTSQTATNSLQKLCNQSEQCSWRQEQCVCQNAQDMQALCLQSDQCLWQDGACACRQDEDTIITYYPVTTKSTPTPLATPSQLTPAPTSIPLPPDTPSAAIAQTLPQKSQVVHVRELTKVKSIGASSESSQLQISGTAMPDSQVMIYIFSDPIVVTTQADSDGEWSYTLQETLSGGEHKIFAVSKNSQAQYVRSRPIQFSIIPTAIAAESSDFEIVVEPTTAIYQDTILKSIGIIALAVFALFVIVVVLRPKRR